MRINDVVRTSFVTKYLDGVKFLSNKFETIASDSGLSSSLDYEAKEDGYYAAHFYVDFDCEIPTHSWETSKIRLAIEIQITTQLQEVIKRLLHTYYEEKRKSTLKSDVKWQWDYKSDEFSTNYLGHILHYIEGMIMEVREKQNKGDSYER